LFGQQLANEQKIRTEAERNLEEFSALGISLKSAEELKNWEIKYKELEEKEKKNSEKFSQKNQENLKTIADLEKTCGEFFPKFQVKKKWKKKIEKKNFQEYQKKNLFLQSEIESRDHTISMIKAQVNMEIGKSKQLAGLLVASENSLENYKLLENSLKGEYEKLKKEFEEISEKTQKENSKKISEMEKLLEQTKSEKFAEEEKFSNLQKIFSATSLNQLNEKIDFEKKFEFSVKSATEFYQKNEKLNQELLETQTKLMVVFFYFFFSI
jgi:hypothetical protein